MSAQFLSPDSFKAFGELLKFLRRREQLTQFELSVSVGYSEAQISRLEQSQRLPDLAALKALFIPALHLENEPEWTARFLFLAQSARQDDLPAPGASPYKGLLFFDQADADLFFGREILTTHLARRITGLAIDASPRFLAVVGASGSGKSSLVRAGLAVALQRAGWKIHTFTPTSNPLSMLEASYNPAEAQVDKNQLVIVDQFEETFTLCRDEDERLAFIERLLNITGEKTAGDIPAKTTVVIALRADFYWHCAQYPRLRGAVAAQQEYIGQMTKSELRRAIEEPARRGGWEFEPGLVDILLNDIGADGAGQPEPGALPLLSHALLATWERRRGHTFTLDGYRTSGGVRGAIAETAESVFTDQLNREQQELARDVFLRLTELGEGTEDTRRRAALNELAHTSEDAIPLRTVLNTLADARLITLNADSAEVAHEALIREWHRLHEWLTQNRAGLLLHRHLTDSALEWERRERDAAELYRGARLAQISEWAEANADRLNPVERAFITASIEQESRDALEREAQRQRELTAAQKLAETEKERAAEQTAAAHRLRRRARFLAGAAALAALLAVAGVLIAITANNNARLATAHQLASSAEASLQVDSGQSISLVLESLQIQPMVDTYSLLHRALLGSHIRSSILAHSGEAGYIAINMAGDRLATIGGDSFLKLWRINGTEIDPSPAMVIDNIIQGVSCKDAWANKLLFIPDSNLVAVVNCDSYITLVNVQTGQIVRKFTPSWGHDTTGLASSPDGNWIAAFSLEGQVAIWDTASGVNLLTFQAHEPIPNGFGMTCLDFSPVGHQLATGGKNGEVKIWDLEKSKDGLTATLIAQADQPNEDFVQAIHYDSTGGRLADATLKYIHLLNLVSTSTGSLLSETIAIPINTNVRINSLFYSPDGERLVTAQLGTITFRGYLKSSGNGIQIWETASGRLLEKIIPQDQLLSGVMSADGQTFFSSQAGGEIHSWDISTLGNPEGLAVPGVSSDDSLNLSQDGRRLLIMNQLDLNKGSYAFTWDRLDGNNLTYLKKFTITLGVQQARVMVSKDLTRIVTCDPQNLCRVFDAASGELLSRFQVGQAGTYVVFGLSPDGGQILMQTNISDTENIIEVWDLPTTQRLYRILIADLGFSSIFAPDGNNLITYSSNNDPNLVRWWNPVTGQATRQLDAQNGTLFGVIFTPDQKYLVSWGDDQTIKIHEVASGKLVRTLTPPAQIDTVIVSPDGKTIAVSLATFQTTLYSFADGQELVTLPGASIVFLPDRPVVLNTIPDDSTVYAFALDNSDLVRLACERLKNITSANSAAPDQLKICQDQGQ